MADVNGKLIFGWVRNILNQYTFMNDYCCFARSRSSCSRPTWNGLPDATVRKIFGQLELADRARLMVVSKSWKRILCRDDLPTVPELWRLLSPSNLKNKRHVKFRSASEGFREYCFKLPELFRKDVWLCGSSGGWLVLASGPKFDPDFFLWNPLNDVVMTLPRLSTTVPLLHQALESGPSEYNISSYIKRVIVFSQECVVAVVLSRPYDDDLEDFLFICTPKDRKWTVFGRDHFHALSDILFHDGKLYVLAGHITKDKDKKSTNSTTTVCLSKCQVQVCIMFLDYETDAALGDGSSRYEEDVVSNPMFNITYGDKISEHLVEFSGQLLVVAVVFDLLAYNSDGDGPVETFRCHQIQRFDVRKVDGMEKFESLDKRIIALADTGSLIVPPSAVYQGEQVSGIAFTTQFARGIVGDQCDEEQSGSNDQDGDDNSDCDGKSDDDDNDNEDNDYDDDDNEDNDYDDDDNEDNDYDDDDNEDSDYDEENDKIQCVAREDGFFNLETREFGDYHVRYYKHPGLFISGWHMPKLL